MVAKANEVIEFWFNELTPKQWFVKSDELDKSIKKRFSSTLEAAEKGELWHWRGTEKGRLAEIIVLDQFSRNIYRDTPKAFAQDAIALVLAQEAVAQCADKSLEPHEKSFLYMPYMHSESKLIHKQAIELFDQPGLENNYEFEVKHKEIIDRFGRYPHRNAILGRESTSEEEDFLKQPGSSF
ncbi:DUF924 family protein [Idiomarina loihiensis]|jgi:uncharacterized protein (DUF924 family)|uniref:Uncharacterized conserved protein n=1 Tax=Idiomarina loihiensis (strain ATCC BAA-735 / DSM 15497 / L2-TR) TaxID=283942 RepID=Q5QUA2_IDILO|nr:MULTISPECIES: DUF924 family protein [Idiomarina]AAV82415.1 Uncharacterized conserved protein [Idiomarina loihiensis L2TR]AGM36449.1 hypothetical protein K734_07930 [Idiomarina loihiensis GSL 199]